MSEEERFERARSLFEAAHAEDPRQTTIQGENVPFAVAYHRALARSVSRLVPDASEALRLAALSQHIRRWAVPRSDFPMTTIGYKQWRSSLAQMHAREARSILESVSYDPQTIERVTEFLLKKSLKKDPDVGIFEDAVCLVFLELELASFAEKHPDEKLVDILQKTWAKMTQRGRDEALVSLESAPARIQALVARALGNTS